MIVSAPRRCRLAIAACAGAHAVALGAGPSDAPQLKILSPDERRYVTGPTLLRASIDAGRRR